jgi:TRAP-type uncharacterized transport system fused permease subunit
MNDDRNAKRRFRANGLFGKKTGRRKRSFAGPVKYVVTALTVLLAVFHLYTAFFGLFPSMQQRSFHIAFVLALIFLLYPATSRSPMERPSPLDWICAGLGALCSLYVFFNYDAIASRAGMYLDYEIYLGIVFTALVFEAARRTLGNVMPVFCSLFLLFAYFGRSLPGRSGTSGSPSPASWRNSTHHGRTLRPRGGCVGHVHLSLHPLRGLSGLHEDVHVLQRFSMALTGT